MANIKSMQLREVLRILVHIVHALTLGAVVSLLLSLLLSSVSTKSLSPVLALLSLAKWEKCSKGGPISGHGGSSPQLQNF